MNRPLVISSPSLTHVRAMCLGKTKFPSPEIAWYVLDYNQRHQIKNKITNSYLLKAYRCPYCGTYHLGNSNKKNRLHHTS